MSVPAMRSSFPELEYVTKRRLTLRDRFLDEIEAVMPWSALVSALESL